MAESTTATPSRPPRIFKPPELEGDRPHGPWNCRGADIWDLICAALAGDATAIRRLLARDPNLVRSEHWYTQPLHFAVREGHVEAVEALLAGSSDPTFIRYAGEDLETVARDRGHEEVARIIAEAKRRRHGITAAQPHAVHAAAGAGDVAQLKALLDAPGAASLVNLRDPRGRTPLHHAVPTGRLDVAGFLLDRGAEIDATLAAGDFYNPDYARPIDLAIRPGWRPAADWRMVGYLLARGAEPTITLAAAAGDLAQVRAMLDADPKLISFVQPNGRRPLPMAAAFGHMEVVKLLLERGADPNWPEDSSAPRGTALHAAARAGNREMVELLLAKGADPNGTIDSSGSATWAAKDHPEIRRLLLVHGGRLDAFDYAYDGNVEAIAALADRDPSYVARSGCGGAYAAAITNGNWDVFNLLVNRGVRVQEVVTSCRSYLWHTPAMTRVLLEKGLMSPNLPDWQSATPLHSLCSRDGRGRANEQRVEVAKLFLEFGADVNAIDEEYRSTPLGWAARCNLPDMAELLLSRGTDASAAGERWATPLAWARKRGHSEVEAMLKKVGARD